MDIPEGFEAIPNGFEVVQQPQGRAPDFKDNIPVPRAGTYQEPKGVDDFGEYVKGAGEAALSLATSVPATVAASIAALASPDRSKPGTPAIAGQIAHDYTYEPRTEMGQRMTDSAADILNNLIPVGAVAHTMPPARTAPRYAPPKPGGVDMTRLEPTATAAKVPDGYEAVPLDFWKNRAAVTQAIAQDARIREGQSPIAVNSEGVAGSPAALEGLRRSTEDITYENVPPDGSIPRSTPDGRLTVPRGNEWPIDENGIPVRSGMPETQVEGLQNVNVNQPHVNDMGNAIQEANGPMLGAGDVYGSEPLGVPQGQRGAINMDMFDPLFKVGKELDDGIRLVMRGSQKGPVVLAYDPQGKRIAEAGFSQDMWARPPEPTHNLEAQWVTTDPNKLTNMPDADRLAPTTPSKYKGLASEMYKFVSEMGNDIVASGAQTPEGQAMWARWEKHGFATNGVIPKAQRGAIDLGPGSTPSPVAKLTKDDPAVIAARGEVDALAKKNVANKILGNPYVDTITTPEQALAAAQNAKDIGPVTAFRNKTVTSGLNSAALSSNNPVIKFARQAFRKAETEANVLSEQYITGPDGLAKKWQLLTADQRNDVMAVLHKQDRAQEWFSPEKLRDAGLSEKQIDVLQHVKDMEQKKLEVWNEKRQQAGLPAVDEQPGHFPGIFTGDYKTMVRDKDGNVIGYVGTNTRWIHNRVIEDLKKQYPAATFEFLGRKGLAGLARGPNSVAMSELAQVLAKNDPKFADLQDAVNKLIAQNADKMYGASNHALGKKEGGNPVFGSEGNKPWRNATENTNEAMTAYKQYWDEGMRSHTNLPAETQLKSLLNSPDLNMPNVKSYLDKYVNHLSGRSVSDFGRAMDTLLDTLPRALGVGPSYIRGLVDQSTKRTGQLLMGAGNIGHSIVQMLQVPAMSVPQFVNIAKQFNLPLTDVGAAQARGIADQGAFLKEMWTKEKAQRDPVTRAMMDFASENGMSHFSEFQEIKQTEQSASARVADKAIDINRTIPEVSTRPFTFFTLFRLLDNVPHLTMEQKLRAALNATDEAMINYSPREKPMIYSDLGQLGKLTGSLSTFKHGAYAQAGRLIKGGAKGNLAPLATFAAINFALAGVRGIYGYDDADSIVKYITGMAGNRRSIRELLLDPNTNSEVIKSGALSAYTGLDLAGRVNVNGFIPDNPLQAVVGPFGAKIEKIGERAVQAAKNLGGAGNGPIDFKNLALELMPGGPVHHNVREWLMNDPKTNRLMGQDALPGNDRTPADITANKYGFTSLRQGNLGNSQYNDLRRQQSKLEDQKAIEKQAQELHAQGLFARQGALTLQGNNLVQKYIQREGDPQQLISRVVSEAENMALNKQQRLQGIPDGSLKSIYRYKNYDRSRKYNNAD